MTDTELDALEKLYAATTPGEWRAYRNESFWQLDSDSGQIGDFCASMYIHTHGHGESEIGEITAKNNAILSAALHNSFPALAARMKAAEEALLALRRYVPIVDNEDPLHNQDCCCNWCERAAARRLFDAAMEMKRGMRTHQKMRCDALPVARL